MDRGASSTLRVIQFEIGREWWQDCCRMSPHWRISEPVPRLSERGCRRWQGLPAIIQRGVLKMGQCRSIKALAVARCLKMGMAAVFTITVVAITGTGRKRQPIRDMSKLQRGRNMERDRDGWWCR